ncbi:MAG: hypothetical protein ABIR78_07015, partial [Ferruginibacter sp.]
MEENKNIEPEQTPENIPEAITPSPEVLLPEPEIITESKNEEMEVHHHTHAAHGKKTWKAYFWEFLMLFLAVFCGFLAEYQLEHMIEHDRAKELSKSMYEDLKKDTAALKANIVSVNKKMSSADNILDVLRSPRE